MTYDEAKIRDQQSREVISKVSGYSILPQFGLFRG
jgi:hypothetical protein